MGAWAPTRIRACTHRKKSEHDGAGEGPRLLACGEGAADRHSGQVARSVRRRRAPSTGDEMVNAPFPAPEATRIHWAVGRSSVGVLDRVASGGARPTTGDAAGWISQQRLGRYVGTSRAGVSRWYEGGR